MTVIGYIAAAIIGFAAGYIYAERSEDKKPTPTSPPKKGGGRS